MLISMGLTKAFWQKWKQENPQWLIERNKRIGIACKKYFLENPEARERVSLMFKGHMPWNKGLTKEMDARVSQFWLGKKRSLEDRTKMRDAQLSNPVNYWLGKKRPDLSAWMKTQTGKLNNHYGKHQTGEWKARMSRLKKQMIAQGIITMPHNNPSMLELKMIDIVNRNKLPYRFVGNGDVLVGTKRPDFIRTDGRKIALEVFYKKHKKWKFIDVKKWEANRRAYFARRGWRIMFFDNSQVNESNVLRKLFKYDYRRR